MHPQYIGCYFFPRYNHLLWLIGVWLVLVPQPHENAVLCGQTKGS